MLRETIETLKGDYEAKIQEIERAARDEMKQLHATVAALRAELEKSHGR